MTPAREPFARYRERLEAAGFHPSRTRGQNFLVDPNLHRVVADAVAPTEADVVLEVGPGLGFLTRELVGRGPRVVAVEIDERLAAFLREELRGLPGRERVELVVRDVLGPHGGLAPEVESAVAEARAGAVGRFLVVANLPYSISGPFLAAMFRARGGLPAAMALLVQRELGERLAAAPGSRTYGGLSATLGAAFSVEVMRRVPAEAFRPRPRVESAIVRLTARPDGPAVALDAGERGAFADFVRAVFGSRRKKLRSALRNLESRAGRSYAATAEQLEKRPEQLAPDELLALWRTGS